MDRRKTKLLVTGASGLLGNKIVELTKNDYITTPVHNTKPLRPNSVMLDITDAGRVSNLFSNLKPDVVLHTASPSRQATF